MELDIPRLLAELATRRPIFHSEADLQHAFAWSVQQLNPHLAVRLEYPLARPENKAIDVVIRGERKTLAVELKYPCALFETHHSGEIYALKNHSAADYRRYDILKDVLRMERFVQSNERASAAVLVITNDPAIWLGPKSEATDGAAFALREAQVVKGELRWSQYASPGNVRGREAPILLRGSYVLNWKDYARINDQRYGLFRFLYIPITKEVAEIGETAEAAARSDAPGRG